MSLTTMWVKSVLRYPLDIRRAQSCLVQSPARTTTATQRPIVLDISTPQLHFDCGRHLNALSLHAQQIGSPFFLRSGRILFAGIVRKRYGMDLLSDPAFHYLSPQAEVPQHAVVLRDGLEIDPQLKDRDDLTHYRLMIGRECVADAPVMPYPMHPHSLQTLAHLDLVELRKRTNRHRIFFAGCQKKRYATESLKSRFGLLSRPQMIMALQREFSNRIASSLAAWDDQRDIALINTADHAIASADWLATLSSSQFFLCCPGVCQPMCHNAIEAMSVGCIPLIQYGDRFTPPLVDGVNAICFAGESGLIDAVQRIDRLSEWDITSLRQRVIDYYESHLRGDRFLQRLRDGELAPNGAMVSLPFHDENFF